MLYHVLSKRHILYFVAGSQVCLIFLFLLFNPLSNLNDSREQHATRDVALASKEGQISPKTGHPYSNTDAYIAHRDPVTFSTSSRLIPTHFINASKTEQHHNGLSHVNQRCLSDLCIPTYPILHASGLHPQDSDLRREARGDLRKIWSRIRTWISGRHLYNEKDDVDSVLRLLATSKIKKAEAFTADDQRNLRVDDSKITDFGSTPKWLLTLEGGQRVMFKPKW